MHEIPMQYARPAETSILVAEYWREAGKSGLENGLHETQSTATIASGSPSQSSVRLRLISLA